MEWNDIHKFVALPEVGVTQHSCHFKVSVCSLLRVNVNSFTRNAVAGGSNRLRRNDRLVGNFAR